MSTEDVQAISEVVNLRCAGGSAEFFTQDEPGVEVVQAAPVSASSSAHDTSIDLDESRIFDVRDLVNSAIEIHRGSQLRSRDVLQFVILCRPKEHSDDDVFGPSPQDPGTDDNTAGRDTRPQWTVPDVSLFNDIVNRAECHMAINRLACLKTQKWSNMWGRVGLVGLSAKDPELIRDYRNVIEQLQDNNYCYTIFPRDAIDKRGSVSILLRDNFRAYDPHCLPTSLFSRNRGLRGTLRLTHIKSYNNTDKSRGGASKREWRLALLQGCPSFMASLELFEEDHKFSIGCGHIFIRGGIRKPRTAPTRTTNSRTNNSEMGPPPTGQARQGPRRLGGNSAAARNTSLDGQFTRHHGGGRGRGTGSGNINNEAPRPGAQAGPSQRASTAPRRQ